MEKLDALVGALEKYNILHPTEPREKPTIEIDIYVVHFGVTGKGEHATLHAVGIMTGSTPSIIMCRPKPTDVRPWLYVHEHFDVINNDVDAGVMCSKLYRPGNIHLIRDTENTFNLKVLSILSGYAQNTPYADQFLFNIPINHTVTISQTACGWVDDITHGLVGGQALAHVLMNITTPASFVDVWVDSHQVETLVTRMRRIFPCMGMGVRVDGTVVMTRPGVVCACRIHVRDVWASIMDIHPDYTQCVFDGNKVSATPRCMLALHTNTSTHPPGSKYVWMSLDSGMRVVGETTPRWKPTVNTHTGFDKTAWNLITQYGCVDVSSDDRVFLQRHAAPQLPTRWRGKLKRMMLEEYLLDPSGWSRRGCGLYVYVDRMCVEGEEDDCLRVRREDTGVMHMLERFIGHISTQYRIRHESIRVRVEGTPTHALNGGTLAHVPVGCSVSGVLWWNEECVHSDWTVFFYLVDPKVHPGHLRLY